MKGKVLSLLAWGLGVTGLIAVAICLSILLLFTGWTFSVLGFHPIAVEFIGGEIDRAVLLIFRHDGSGFGDNEISHLVDVKSIIGTLRWVLSGAGVFLALLWALERRMFRRACLWSPWVFAAIVGSVTGAYFLFGFQRVGIFLHTAVFPNGNWSFPNSSLIIRLYGTDEMVTGTVFVMGVSLSILAVAAIALRLWRQNGVRSAG